METDATGLLTKVGKAQALGQLAKLVRLLPPAVANQSAHQRHSHSGTILQQQLSAAIDASSFAYELRAAVLQHVPDHAELFPGLLQIAALKVTQWLATHPEPKLSWQRPQAAQQPQLRDDITFWLQSADVNNLSQRFRAFDSKHAVQLQALLVARCFKPTCSDWEVEQSCSFNGEMQVRCLLLRCG